MTAPFTDPNVAKELDSEASSLRAVAASLATVAGELVSANMTTTVTMQALVSIATSLATIAKAYPPQPTDATFNVTPVSKETTMTKQKINLTVKIPKAGAKKAVVTPVTITGPVDIAVQFLDDTGVAIPGIAAANVTSSLASDNPAVTFTQKDALTFNGQIAAGTTTGTANLTLTASVTNPPAGPFTATCVVTLNIPAPAPTPVDVTFTITPSA